ncbi:hypothetical protein [Bradyrhizobium sp. dw_78]|nr:hypothetical protein [Bradyrhizobium sp. dw_78]
MTSENALCDGTRFIRPTLPLQYVMYLRGWGSLKFSDSMAFVPLSKEAAN